MTVPFLNATVVQGQVVITIEGGAAPSAIVRLSPSRATEISARLGALALDAIEDEAKIVEEDIARLEAELAARRTALARMRVYVPSKPDDLRSDLADAQARLAQPTSPPTDQLQRGTSGDRAALGRLPAIEDAIFDGTNKPVIVIADAATLADLTEPVTYAMISTGDPALSIHPTIEQAREARLFYTSGNRCPVHFCSTPHSFLSRPARFALIVSAGRHRLDTDEGNLFQLAEKRTYSFIGGKIVMFFDVNDTHIAEASSQYARARVFRLPFTEPGS